MFKHIDTARSVAASLDRDWLEVLKLCIPKIVVFILPQFAASRSGETSNDQVKKRTAHATACYDLLAEQATKEVTALFIFFFFNVRYMYKEGMKFIELFLHHITNNHHITNYQLQPYSDFCPLYTSHQAFSHLASLHL